MNVDIENVGIETKEDTKDTKDTANYKKVNPPFGYFGSKNKIALQLCQNLPPHNCWVEMFCGSAALTLAKSPAPIEIINDFDDAIVNVFKQIRDNYNELIQLIENTPYAEAELKNARIHRDDDNDLEKARKFLVQSMMAINGAFGEEKGGFSYSNSYSRNGKEARVNRWTNLPDRLKKVTDRLKHVRIDNKNAIDALQKFTHRPATLVYLDPPYLANRKPSYNLDANEEHFHKELLEIANQAHCMIFISGYENELYNSLLSENNGWHSKTIETTTKGSQGNSYPRTETVWMNRHFVHAVETNKVPIDLTAKEARARKVNPERIFE